MHQPNRRVFLAKAGLAGLSLVVPNPYAAASEDPTVNDVTQLNPVRVKGQRRPSSTEEVTEALQDWPGTISIGGGRFSMGGQIAAPDSLHLDMRGMNAIVAYMPDERIIRVQSGATWRAIQDRVDRHGQSVKIMQSYSNFTVGGSVSVNCHGRYVGRGPLVNSIRALQLVLPNGDVVEASRSENTELFRAAVGGYGGIGVITEVELDLDENTRIERVVKPVRLEDYPEYFRQDVLSDSQVVLHNADLVPPGFDRPTAISWIRTEKTLTESRRLVPLGQSYSKEQNAIWAASELPGGASLQKAVISSRLNEAAVVWRNYETSLDARSLEPRTRAFSTYCLQEYFIPVSSFLPFARAMARILKERSTGALNVSIRHSPPDPLTMLPWAPTEVFCFVLYHKQRVTYAASALVESWTRELVDAALRYGGRYYLPYRLHPTQSQFARAYPEAGQFAAVKKMVDPENRLRNLLWDRYLFAKTS
jgi:FAD/FMN-containing dehydrogenase